MKMFDWKRREADESAINDLDNFEFTLDNLKPAPGSRQRKKRKGRGIAAGQGATCGYGMRGQKSRSGRPTRPGFEGGQTPLYRRLPKFVGKPMGPGHQKTVYNTIKLDQLNGVAAGSTCNCKYYIMDGQCTLMIRPSPGRFVHYLFSPHLSFFCSQSSLCWKLRQSPNQNIQFTRLLLDERISLPRTSLFKLMLSPRRPERRSKLLEESARSSKPPPVRSSKLNLVVIRTIRFV